MSIRGIVFSLSGSTKRFVAACELCQHATKRWALQSADCSHLKKKKKKKKKKTKTETKTKKKNKNVLGARLRVSLLLWSSSSLSLLQQRRAKAQRRRSRESFKKEKVFVVVKFAPDLEEGERKFWLKNNHLSLSLSSLLRFFFCSRFFFPVLLLSRVLFRAFFETWKTKRWPTFFFFFFFFSRKQTVSFRKKKSTRTWTLTVATISSKAVSDDARTFYSCWRLSRFGSACWRAAGTVLPTAIRLC